VNSLLPQLPQPNNGRTGWPWTEETPPSLYRNHTDWPRVSIVTPSFNQAAYLEETIRSVLLQNYPNLQFIVIDGGSTDESRSVLETYSPWLDYWVSEPDEGQPHAIQKGFCRATGDWINWINSDDTLQDGGLKNLVQHAIKSGSSVDIVAGRTLNIRDGSPFGRYGVTLPPTPPESWLGLGINQPGSLLRRSVVNAVGGVRRNLHSCMDLDLWLRILLRNGNACISLIDTDVATYRYHLASKTCQVEDAFALEEFVVLTDLAANAGSRVAQTLSSIRKLSPIQSLRFEIGTENNPLKVDRAFLCRLLIDDSLLYRALLRLPLSHQKRNDCFRSILRQLRPITEELFPGEFTRIEANAFIKAQQSVRRLVPILYWEVFRRCPGFRILLEGLRLLRSNWTDHSKTESKK
jgi:glycosyltransferase involved in cell wall biosynthesis